MTRATRCSEWVASQVQNSSEVSDRSLMLQSPHGSTIKPTLEAGRQRKRDIASLEDDDPEPESITKPTRKRPRRYAIVRDDVENERDESMSAAASSSISTTTSSIEFSRHHSASPMKQFNRLAAQLQPVEKLPFNQIGPLSSSGDYKPTSD